MKLPEGFERAEFLVTKGAVELNFDRRDALHLASCLAMLQRQSADAVLADLSSRAPVAQPGSQFV